MNRKTMLAPFLALAVLASGCATLAPVATNDLPAQIQLTPVSPFVSTWRSPEWPADARYAIGTVQWRLDREAKLSAEDRRNLESALNAALSAQLQGLLSDGPRQAGDLTINPTITGVDPSSPAANVALSLLLGPVDTGGASVQFQVTDTAKGQDLGVLLAAKNGRLFSSKGFKRWGHAEQAFESAASALADFLSQGTPQTEPGDAP